MDKTTTSTNSPIGSHHWYNTLVCRIKRIGEYMHSNPNSDTPAQEWGKVIYDSCNELLTGRDHINSSSPPQQAVSDEEIKAWSLHQCGEKEPHNCARHEGRIQGAKWMRDRTPPSEAETILRELVRWDDLHKEMLALPTNPDYDFFQRASLGKKMFADYRANNPKAMEAARKWCADNPVKG